MPNKSHYLFLLLITFLISNNGYAHPNGNIVVMNDCVLWPYVSPVGDIEHHACIMLWDQQSKPTPYLISEHESSDYFLHVTGNTLYIVEGRYISSADKFQTRILKTSDDFGRPQVIWPWFDDKWHIGVHGFKMLSDNEIVFNTYPEKMLYLKKGEDAKPYFDFDHIINKMRPVGNDLFLLSGENTIWLTNKDGKIIKQWNHILEDLSKKNDVPMNSNRIFDADYYEGELLLAYWGKRSFELIDTSGNRKVLLQQKPHWVPHWVAFHGNKKLLFASNLDFENAFTADGSLSTIYPNFQSFENGTLKDIWKVITK